MVFLLARRERMDCDLLLHTRIQPGHCGGWGGTSCCLALGAIGVLDGVTTTIHLDRTP